MTEIVGDWEVDLLDPLVANMRALAAGISERAYIEDHAKIAAEVQEALGLLAAWQEQDIGGSTENWVEANRRLWWDFWNYLGEHIRGWWD